MRKYLIICSISSFIKDFLVVVASFVLSEAVSELAANNIKQSMILLLVIVVIYYIIVFVYYFKNVSQEKYLASGITNVRKRLLQSKQDYELSNLISDMDILEKNYFQSKVLLIQSLITTITSLAGIFFINLYIGIFIFIMCVITNLFSKFIENYQKKSVASFTEKSKFFTNKVNDLYLGRKDFKSNHLLNLFTKLNHQVFDFFQESRIYFNKQMNLAGCGFIFISSTNQLLTYFICFLLVGFGYVKIGVLLALMVLVSPIYNNYSQINLHRNNLKASKQLLDKYNVFDNQEVQLTSFKDKLELKNVSFSYGDKEILTEVNFIFERNKKYAIIAESGKGKTTLLKLLNGEMPINKGEIIVDNKIVKNYQGLANLSYVNQFSHIFNDSLEFNLSLGQKIDQHKLIEAMKVFGIDSFISRLEDSLTSSGTNISGGQKQRVILARNMLMEKDIVILDESFSHLDKESALALENYFLSQKDITLIAVNHYVETKQLEKYDVVYYL